MKVFIEEELKYNTMVDDSGSLNVLIDGNVMSLTSKYDLDREEKRFLNTFDTDWVNQVILVFGMGRGNWLESDILKEILINNHVIVIEPAKQAYEAQKNKIDNIASDNVVLCIGHDFSNVVALFASFEGNSNNIRFQKYGNYANVYGELYKVLLKIMRDYIMHFKINQNTIKMHNELITSNILKNTFNNVRYYRINNFKNMYGNIPALIVSAGPSLEKQLDKIKDFNGIIFSGGRTLKKLLELGVRPDFYVSIDPHIKVFYLVEDVLDADVPLISFVEGNSNIISEYNGPKILMSSTNVAADNKYMNQEIDCLNVGACVANASVAVADYMGCDPIVFIGQDLAYTGGQHHSDSTVNSKFESSNKAIDNSATIEIDGYYGDKVYTNAMFHTFLAWFEKHFETSEQRAINCTEGGAKINGTIQMPFSEYLASNDNKSLDINKTELFDGLDSFAFSKDDANELIEMTNKALEILDRSKKNSKYLKQEYMKKYQDIKKVNKLVKKLDDEGQELLGTTQDYLVLNILVTDAFNDFSVNVKNRQSSKSTMVNDVVESNVTFYKSLYDKLAFFKNEVEKIVGEAYVE